MRIAGARTKPTPKSASKTNGIKRNGSKMNGAVEAAVGRLGSAVALSAGDHAYIKAVLPRVIAGVAADPSAAKALTQAKTLEGKTFENAKSKRGEVVRGWWSRAKSWGRRAVGFVGRGLRWVLDRPEAIFVASLALLFVKRWLCDFLTRQMGRQREVVRVVRDPTMGERVFAQQAEMLGSIRLIGDALTYLLNSIASFVLPFTNWVEKTFSAIASSPWTKLILAVFALLLLRWAVVSVLDIFTFGYAGELVNKMLALGGSVYVIWRIFSDECIPPEQTFEIEWVEPGAPNAIHRLQLEHKLRPNAPLQDEFERNLRNLAAYNNAPEGWAKEQKKELEKFYQRLPRSVRRRDPDNLKVGVPGPLGVNVPVRLSKSSKAKVQKALEYGRQKSRGPVPEQFVTKQPAAANDADRCKCLGPGQWDWSYTFLSCPVAPNCPDAYDDPNSFTGKTKRETHWPKWK